MAPGSQPAEREALHVGVIARRTHPANPALSDFCRALEIIIGERVAPATLPTYDAIVEAFGSGEVAFSWLPPLLVVKGRRAGALVPVALPVRGGTPVCSSVLFTRTNSSMRRVADLRGARVAWVDPQSATGYVVIRATLQAAGVDLERAFGVDRFVGSHDAVVRAVLSGEADVGATYAYISRQRMRVRAAGWGKARVHIIARSDPFPAEVLVAAASLPAASVERLREALVSAGEWGHSEVERAARALLQADRFVAPGDSLEPIATLLCPKQDEPADEETVRDSEWE